MPYCNQTTSCSAEEAARRHPDYTHATTWEEAAAAVERGDEVYDNDGDLVSEVVCNDAHAPYYRYRSPGEAPGRESRHFPDCGPGKLLLPPAPLTNEDMEYVRKSLGVGS